ncbi:MAG: hypothetical protein HWN51_07455 [Desulfobacterales bacterium]|nr:hypothetical protein [Desulfobacterales bacterium]
MNIGKVESMQLRNAHQSCTMAGSGMIAAMVPVSKLFRAILVALAVLLSPPILSAQRDTCSITIDGNVQMVETDGSLQSIRITGTAEDCDNVLVTIQCAGDPVFRQTGAGSGTWQVEFDVDYLKKAGCDCFDRIRIDADCAYGSCPESLVTSLKCDKEPECDKGVDLCCLLRGIVLGALILSVIFFIISILDHSWAKSAFKVSAYVTLLFLILLIVFCCI